MTKAEAINLYGAIREFKNGSMNKETLYPFIKLRMKLKEIHKWLAEKVEVDRIFTFEEAVDYCVNNDVDGSLLDEIIRLLIKE